MSPRVFPCSYKILVCESFLYHCRKALCDPLPEVRQAAARTFDSLYSTVGHRALDDILSPLLKQLVRIEFGSLFRRRPGCLLC